MVRATKVAWSTRIQASGPLPAAGQATGPGRCRPPGQCPDPGPIQRGRLCPTFVRPPRIRQPASVDCPACRPGRPPAATRTRGCPRPAGTRLGRPRLLIGVVRVHARHPAHVGLGDVTAVRDEPRPERGDQRVHLGHPRLADTTGRIPHVDPAEAAQRRGPQHVIGALADPVVVRRVRRQPGQRHLPERPGRVHRQDRRHAGHRPEPVRVGQPERDGGLRTSPVDHDCAGRVPVRIGSRPERSVAVAVAGLHQVSGPSSRTPGSAGSCPRTPRRPSPDRRCSRRSPG